MADLEVSSVKEFAAILIAGIIAGIALALYRKLQRKAQGGA